VGDLRSDSLDEASSKHLSHERYSSQGPAPTSDGRSDDEPLSEIIAKLRERDLNNVIAARLWRDHSGFTDLIGAFGACAVSQVIKVRLIDAIVDGRAPGSIRSLNYFHGALVDDRTRREMERRGERPGDVLGAHRRCSGTGGLSLTTEPNAKPSAAQRRLRALSTRGN
jgi:hypothetical protein